MPGATTLDAGSSIQNVFSATISPEKYTVQIPSVQTCLLRIHALQKRFSDRLRVGGFATGCILPNANVHMVSLF
jgi:hypothetical protein